ncbi:MAG: yhjD 2, partial [Solirubrobacterales bacterium]|nr:yhjD 2 [Solirubrobacterales bacterium]
VQFLEQLFATLRRAGVLKSQRGVKGGYTFARDPSTITVLEIVELLDGPLGRDSEGVFALVLGLIAFVYATAVAIVLCVEVNVVRAERLWPRALLTPFTDAVDLTPGDELAYTRQAEAQRLKGFEEVDVTFGPRPE